MDKIIYIMKKMYSIFLFILPKGDQIHFKIFHIQKNSKVTCKFLILHIQILKTILIQICTSKTETPKLKYSPYSALSCRFFFLVNHRASPG